MPEHPVSNLPVNVKEKERFAPSFSVRLFALLRSFDPEIPEAMQEDPEIARRAHLTARFGLLGSIFGVIYALFYLAIGHRWGAAIVLTCSAGFWTTPVVMRQVQRVESAGNFLVGIMAFGFVSLCGCEGGLKGHAIAWLVCLPLCALLLVGTHAARRWALIVFICASAICAVDLSGHKMPETFDPKWQAIVSSGGYLGLIIFMYALGLIFESSRARAFGRMEIALKELAQSNEHLTELNNEKNEFLGIAAHDLKSPLTVILGCAEMIQVSGNPSNVQKMTDSIVGATTRMKNLINDLLDANAIEQGKFASRIEPIDLFALVKQCVDNNLPAASRKNIILSLGATPGLWAKADLAATTQILENLISNALKFSPPMTTVTVHTMPETEHVLVAVRDQGPGLSDEDQKKLFGKFTRLTARPTGGESSTGLGLSIVKKLAEAMSGTVFCTSVLGSGATFSLRLPSCPQTEIPMISIVTPQKGDVVPLPPAGTQYFRNDPP
jgi:signal transduction histidine kinase